MLAERRESSFRALTIRFDEVDLRHLIGMSREEAHGASYVASKPVPYAQFTADQPEPRRIRIRIN